jgi:hypothetical protein
MIPGEASDQRSFLLSDSPHRNMPIEESNRVCAFHRFTGVQYMRWFDLCYNIQDPAGPERWAQLFSEAARRSHEAARYGPTHILSSLSAEGAKDIQKTGTTEGNSSI